MTPNQMTFVSMIIAILGGIFFSFSNPLYWVIGCFLFILFSILDCADGELARYYKKSSPIGRYFDLWVHGIESSAMFMGVTFGVHGFVKQPWVFILGFVVVIAFLLRAYSGALKNWHLFEYALLMNDKTILNRKIASRGKKILFFSYYDLKQIFSFFFIPYLILILVVLDIIFRPGLITIGSISFPFNWRLILLLLFTVISPLILIKTILNTLKLKNKLKDTKVND